MNHPPRIGCLIMAAGNASRFGSNKLAAKVDGKMLIEHALETVPREEICKHYDECYDTHYDAATDVLVTVGVSEALDLAMRALIAPGDEVLIPEPCYVSYQACTILAGGVPVAVPAKIENEFRITPEELEEHVTEKTKVLLIGYPNNPTGAIMTRKDLLAVAEFAKKHDLIVISDEIYGDLTYGGEPHIAFSSLPGMQERME